MMLQGFHPFQVIGRGCLVKRDIEFRKNIRSAVDPAGCSQHHTLGSELFGSHEKGEIGTVAQLVKKRLKIDHVRRTVLQSYDVRMPGQLLHSSGFERHLHMHRHIIEAQRQRQGIGQRLVIHGQFRLRRSEIVRRRRNDSRSTAFGGLVRQSQTLLQRGIGHADQNGNAARNCRTNQLGKFITQVIGQTLRLAGRSEDEDSVNTACNHMLHKPDRAVAVQRIVVDQRCDHRRNKTFQSGKTCFHTFNYYN